MNLIIYFTGTGNTLHAGKILAHELGDTTFFRISKNMDKAKVRELINEAASIGILAPVYAGTLPYMVSDFLKVTSFPQDTYIYSLLTCAGSELSAHTDVELCLEETSKRKVDNNFTLTYPSNFQTHMAPKDDQTIKKVVGDAEDELKKIASIIEKREKEAIKVKKFMAAISRASLKIFVKKNTDKNFYSDDKCISCGICQKVCPAANIDLVESKPRWKNSCESCMACINLCPVKAIQYKEKTKTWGRYSNPEINTNELKIN
ncbi:EFR1 family ferrodoxin [Anaerococcus sp. AGMB09787]|uniref:EFR1 family ferrodoxin n=1 Tax=Anaerococcus sp. AGMB09787 TaxID=2922869 RepID=UPI001FAEEB1F|nr:EFR1 family ferrodoxin [Anaerococcus sp. AGMB09787]